MIVRYATLETVLDEQLREIVTGEQYVARHLPRLAESVSSSELRTQLRTAVGEYQSRVERLERVVSTRGVTFQGAHSRVIDAFIKHGEEIVEHRGDDLLLDHGLVSVLRHLESYQRALRESAREVASVLNLEDVVSILDIDLEEHGQMERALTILEEDMLDTIVTRRRSAGKAKPTGEAAA